MADKEPDLIGPHFHISIEYDFKGEAASGFALFLRHFKLHSVARQTKNSRKARDEKPEMSQDLANV